MPSPASTSILAVDDVPANLVALEAVLEPLGVQVVTAPSGVEALRLLLDSEFACILLDVQMPGLDGFETAKLIKARDRTRHIPLLFLTAVNREEASVIRGYTQGAVDYIVKPYDPEILRAKVRVFIELHERDQNLRSREAHLQEEVTAARKEAEAQRDRLRRLFMEAPAHIALTRGPEHVYELSNPPNTAVSGGRIEVGKAVREVLPEFVTQGLLPILDGVYRTGVPAKLSEIPVALQNPDGSQQQLFLNGVLQPTRDTEGEIDGLALFSFDVTEQVLARQKAEALATELREAVSTRDTFLSVASHELRTPLTALGLRLQSLRRALDARGDAEGDRPAKGAVVAAEKQYVRLRDLVDDLLDVSRLASGRFELVPEPLDLSALVAEVLAHYGEAAQAASALQLSAPVPVPGRWDRRRTEQVVTNLVDNALKYGAGKPVEVSVGLRGTTAFVTVTDHGIGIPPADLGRIFERFERAVSPSHYPGLGLGLFIAREIAVRQGGALRAESEPGVGTTFTLELPLET